ncbi:hypothetical protein M758_2G196800 [Ceratodon purpureus]|nr:hypothetical protein M758_2G196800 [Ceratodon purpureus]
MGLQVPAAVAPEDGGAVAVSGRPSVVIVGPRNVGKHSILKRLLAKEELLKDDSSSDSTCHGWRIDTKYYTADVCIWTARLDALDSKDNGPAPLEHCEALLMVFDLSDASTFEKLQQWVEASDLTPYEVQICVGNKADRLPSHFGHIEYRRRLMKRGESSSDPHPEFMDFGIDRTEGSGLLAEEEDDDPELRRRACTEWCTERGIEYIEACAINEVFDKCMSVDGDLQGVPRILDALSAHMWPGLVMKSTQKLTDVRPDSKENDEDGEFSSEDDEDFLIEYEVLSNASTEPWDGNDDLWAFRGADAPPLDVVPSSGEYKAADSIVPATTQTNVLGDHEDKSADASSSASTVPRDESTAGDSGDQIVVVQHSDGAEHLESPTTSADVIETVEISTLEVTEKPVFKNEKEHGAEDLEKMMHEMASMRENMRNMSDGQRREMAAQLAMRMASMFLDDDEDE